MGRAIVFGGLSICYAARLQMGQNGNCNGGSDLLVRLFLGLGAAAWAFAAGPLVDFNRDVRPILSDNCFACHGPDDKHRVANLRLDTEEGLFADRGSYRIVAPGDPAKSRLLARISAATPASRMPPRQAGTTLTEAQIATMRKWIEQGAKWERHWAFVPPQRPAMPAVRNEKWARNPIDRLVLARLEREGLKPSPEADRATLLRRLSFDLTGLPPTTAEVDAFLADKSADAYEKQVDRLLALPQYGERMAMQWLDLARYADTHGYHIDSERGMWKWRDWVIDAFNRNMPFDRFGIEQLAGDLLPNATVEQTAGQRVQPQPHDQLRRRRDSRRVSGGVCGRPRGYHLQRLHGPDGRLRALPRSQVRPDLAEGLLPLLRLLQHHRGKGPRRQERQCRAHPGNAHRRAGERGGVAAAGHRRARSGPARERDAAAAGRVAEDAPRHPPRTAARRTAGGIHVRRETRRFVRQSPRRQDGQRQHAIRCGASRTIGRLQRRSAVGISRLSGGPFCGGALDAQRRARRNDGAGRRARIRHRRRRLAPAAQ